MEIDEKLLSQVSDFLNTREGADILSSLKDSLGLGSDKPEANETDILSAFSSLTGGKKEEPKSSMPNIDMARLIPLISAISSAKTDDRAANLLLALKPLLSKERTVKVDHAISIMRIMALLPILKEHGFNLSDLFSG